MALSNSYNYTTTRDDIIKRAMRIIGALGQGETPPAAAVTEASQALNDLMKEWQADGMQIWKYDRVTFTPVSGQLNYTVGEAGDVAIPTPFKILDVWRSTYNNTSNQSDIKLVHKTIHDWQDIANKRISGTPIYWCYVPADPGSTGTLRLSPIVDDAFINQTGKIIVIYSAPIMDFDSSTDNPDIPSYMVNALVWGLADQLSYEYGIGVVERSQISKKADKHKALALSYDQEEGSVFIQPTFHWQSE